MLGMFACLLSFDHQQFCCWHCFQVTFAETTLASAALEFWQQEGIFWDSRGQNANNKSIGQVQSTKHF